jgi:catalase
MRLACGSGSATQRYGWSDVRGFATRFHLPDSSATDLVSVTLPEFFAPTPQTFLEFTLAAKPTPVLRETPLQKFFGMLRFPPPMPDPYPRRDYQPERRRDRLYQRA